MKVFNYRSFKKEIFSILIWLYCLPIFASPLIITNAQIINPYSKPKLGNIFINDQNIIKVIYGKYRPPKNANTINIKKAFVIPGLIDSHNHVDTVLGLEQDNSQLQKQLVSDYRKQLPHSYLYFGFTTIIDLVTTDKAALSAFKSDIHPDLYICGGAITTANGYPMYYLPESERFKEFPNFIPATGSKLPAGMNTKQHTPQAVMNNISKNGAICVKVFYETGFDKTNLPVPSLRHVKEIVRIAHQQHIPVLVHANSLSAQNFVLESGADIFAHGLWNWQAYDGKKGVPPAIKKTLDKIITTHRSYQPTFRVIGGLIDGIDPKFLNDQQLVNVVPKSLLDWYRTPEGKWYVKLMVGNSSAEEIKTKLLMHQDQLQRVVKYLNEHHINFLFGSDTPSSPTFANPPGYNQFLEMQAWNRAGIPLDKILAAATIQNAKMFHLQKEYGSITPGKIANLVILNKNPLKEISAYDSISAVVLRGKIYPRSLFRAS